MRGFLSISLALLAIVPFTLASDEAATTPTAVVAEPSMLPDGMLMAVNHQHQDCVGPGLPGTAGPHATHTDRVTGFVIDPARPIQFQGAFLNLFIGGICPTALAGPVLRDDFTGTWQVTAVCRGTQNDGATFFQWTVSTVAGFPLSQQTVPGTCIGQLGQPFSLDVTVAISSTSLLNVPLGPAGGARLGITQA